MERKAKAAQTARSWSLFDPVVSTPGGCHKTSWLPLGASNAI